jgi:hypothetical protein
MVNELARIVKDTAGRTGDPRCIGGSTRDPRTSGGTVAESLRKALAGASMVAATLTGTAIAMVPTAASAAPVRCQAGWRTGGTFASWAYCDGGSGEVRARIYCGNDFGHYAYYYGSWVHTGSTSIATCNSTYPYGISYSYETR